MALNDAAEKIAFAIAFAEESIVEGRKTFDLNKIQPAWDYLKEVLLYGNEANRQLARAAVDRLTGVNHA